MSFHILLTIDLPGASSNERNTFYEKMEENGFNKNQRITTAFTAKFHGDIKYLKNEIIEIVRRAISEAGLKETVCCFQIGNNESETYNICLNDRTRSQKSETKDLKKTTQMAKDILDKLKNR